MHADEYHLMKEPQPEEAPFKHRKPQSLDRAADAADYGLFFPGCQ